ncbi:hypothetical protein BSKO_13141 [Bryopsis sp. KO-2023]|nr:hypothetical protein BSKO_13141 [Bryopsis sp. KO-2023]
MAVATCSTPLDEFTEGVHTIEKKDIQLNRVSPSSEADPFQVTEKGSLWIRVSLLSDEIVEKDPETGVTLDPPTKIQHPYPLVPHNEVGKSCMVEFSALAAAPIPQGLKDVVAQLPEGTVQFSVGLGFDLKDETTTEALILNKGSLEDNEIKWGKPKKFFLPAATVRKLREMMEDGDQLPFEIARYLSPDAEVFTDPAFAAYHAHGHVSISEQLMVPGATDILDVATSFSTVATGDGSAPTMMPPPVQNPNPKAKPIEAAPEATKEFCPWSETEVSFKLTFSKPLVPPWQPPPKPSKSFEEVIPRRPEKKAPEPKSATMEFKSQIQSLVEFLKKEYEEIDFEGTEDMKQKKLVFELNKSGKYLDIQTQLKKYLQNVIQERYKTKENMSKDGLAGLYNDLYVHLLDSARDAIKPVESPAPEPPVPDQLDLGKLLCLATEYEIAGNRSDAEKKHQDRIVVSEDPQVWYDYGAFCMRCGLYGRAEECFRDSLSLDPCNVQCLLSLSGLLLHNSIMTDPAFLESAEVFLHKAKELEPDNAMVWALLAIVVEGVYSKDDMRNIHFEVSRLANEATERGESPAQVDGFLRASGLMLDLHLPECADRALAHVKECRDPVDEATIQLGFNRALSAQLQGRDSDAMDILKATMRLAAEEDIRGHLQLGKLHFKAGRCSEACDAYQQGLRTNPAAFTLEAFMHLGACYSAKMDWQSACDVYLQGCISHPCMTLWLGVGIAYLRLGDLHRGELALSEANILDNRNANVWGYLALVALKEQRFDEASMALSRALEEGFKEADLSMEMGQEYFDQGRHWESEGILKRLLVTHASSKGHELLGSALSEQNKHEEAKQHFSRALEDVEESDRVALIEKAIKVNKILGCTDEVERLEAELKAGEVEESGGEETGDNGDKEQVDEKEHSTVAENQQED